MRRITERVSAEVGRSDARLTILGAVFPSSLLRPSASSLCLSSPLDTVVVSRPKQPQSTPLPARRTSVVRQTRGTPFDDAYASASGTTVRGRWGSLGWLGLALGYRVRAHVALLWNHLPGFLLGVKGELCRHSIETSLSETPFATDSEPGSVKRAISPTTVGRVGSAKRKPLQLELIWEH